MTNRDIASQHGDAIKQLRDTSRDLLEDSPEWRALRRRLMTERRQAQRRFWEELARSAGIDLAAIEKAAVGNRDRLNENATKTVESVEAAAEERARAAERAFERRRFRHGDHFPTEPGERALVFRQPVAFYGEARPSECYTSFAGGGAELPVYEASADLAVSEGGALLHPYLFNSDGDCSSHETGFTLHELIYHLPPPAAPFHVTGVNVNLHGRGVGSSIEGSFDFDWTQLISIYVGKLPEGHGFEVGAPASITLDVSMGQYVHGDWQFWPLLTAHLFRRTGDYVQDVLFTGRSQPSNFTLHSPAGGGADLLCYLKIRCTAPTTGDRGGRARLTFVGPGLGIHIGGVTLSGQFDQPVVEQ